jgi:hypothetical protein
MSPTSSTGPSRPRQRGWTATKRSAGNGGSCLPILRLGGVCDGRQTVRRGPVLGNGAGHGGPTKRSARTRPISITKTTRRTAAETLAPPATCGLRSPGRRPSDRSLSRLNRPLLAHPCRCVSLQRPKFDARGNTLATSLVARCRHTGVSAPRGNRKVPNLSDSGPLS